MASRSGALGALLVAVVVTGAAVAVGVVAHSPDPAAPTARPLAVRLASIDTATAAVRRAPFCDAVPAADARSVVGDDAPRTRSWNNGEPLGAGSDVAHEYGCSWSGASGVTAAAWVFAPPVTVARGQELARDAASAKGCAPTAGASAFGSPSVALTCASGGTSTRSFRGLFGDAWLVCQVAGAPAAEAADLADRWCASVLVAAGAREG